MNDAESAAGVRTWSRGDRLCLLAIAALALFLRAWFDGSTVPGRVFLRHDEQHYVDLARELLNGRFVTDYFINPALFGWLVAGATALVGGARVLLGFEASFELFVARETVSPVVLVLAGRALSIAASLAAVPLLARLGGRLFSPRVGLLAALALAVDGVAIGRAPLCGNESMTTLLCLLAVDALLAAGAQPDASPRRRFAAGLLLGIATACKYSAGIFGVVLLAALKRRSVPALLGAAAGFAFGAPATWLNPAAFIDGFSTQASFLHDGYRAEDAQKGQLGWLFYAKTFPASHLGFVVAVAVAGGLIASLIIAARRGGTPHRWLLSASLPLYLFLGSGIFHRDRFLLPATPFLLLHGAWLLHRLLRGDWLPALLRSGAATARSGRIVGAVALLAAGVDGAIETVGRHRQFADKHAAPDAASELHHALLPSLAPDEKVFEFSFLNADELLLRADPWREAGVEPPPATVRDAVLDELRHRGLLPVCSPLRPALVATKSLAELEALLAREGATTLVAIVPVVQLIRPGGLAAANRDPPFRDVAWWPEFVAWLEVLPRRAECVTSDGTLTGAILELRR